ncbi:MAG TPA: cyclic nucleotide-binding domain-containing protein [Gammaproteobacteria bacterium]|nr:cyclic nucleotide-binding domain-containing protein [Gammaproteobacteria bacterium]
MATRPLDRELVKNFSPLSGLKPENQADIASKTQLQELGAGRYLFKQGDNDKRTVYVVKGEVELRSGDKVVKVINAGSDEARHPLAPQMPRHLSARARTDIEFFGVDSDLLDIMLTWDQTGAFEVGELQAQEETPADDWMTTILQTKAFHRIPPANIQAMFMRMEHITRKPGDVIIKQGDDGDFFYIIAAGRCVVTRETPTNKAGIKLAELGVGDSFGEEALISDAKRNATITMLTDGSLVRLAKADFKTLLNEPLQKWVSHEEAKKLVAEGGQWLDVRLPSEFENQHQDGAVNIPLYFIRLKLDTLDPKRKYVVCCDTGRRSSAGAYILSERGFDAYVLKGGLSAIAS